MRRAGSILAAGAVVAAVGVAALPASGGARPAATTVKLKADANGALRFNKRTLHARHGVIKLVMTNPSGSGVRHGIAVEGHGVDKDGRIAKPGQTSTVSVRLKKGRYDFYCPFDGHKAQGMEGKLIVS